MDRAPRPNTRPPPSRTPALRALAPELLELCAHLEARGVHAWLQGEGLLEALRDAGPRSSTPSGAITHTLVCRATPEALLHALPRAIVTAERGLRLTQPTPAGPIDLIPGGATGIGSVLRAFGLSAYAIGFRCADDSWADPADALALTRSGRLDVVLPAPDPPGASDGAAATAATAAPVLAEAPRRYWIAARLLSEHALEPTPRLLAAAREGLPRALEHVPEGAPARRALARVLAAPRPEAGLRFLRECGLTPALFPDLDPRNEPRVAALPAIDSLRWAVWLRGTSLTSALVRLRVPHALARRIERLQALHPVDQGASVMREAGLRRLLGRVGAEELDGLFAWRRLELAEEPASEGRSAREARLEALEARVAEARVARERTGRMRRLALDGHAVMTILGAGPGPHVGRALAHLARHVETHPEDNDRARLRALVLEWAQKNAEALLRRASTGRDPIR
ncbi:MAG: hypothetical protein H6748_00570 [Spirochaetaceae bacterium]|nr:hypothetical protein [Spirochaetaceae bacterium]HPG24173.1 hypothetical protein [Myxococcota bacterium]